MARKHSSEEQIIAALQQVETGAKVAEVRRQMCVSQSTFYAWRKQFGGLSLNELREPRQLREENSRLKRLVADLSLDRQILRKRPMKLSITHKPERRLGTPGREDDVFPVFPV